MFSTNPSINQTWNLFVRHAEGLKNDKLLELFARNPQRAEKLTFAMDGLSLDLSRNHIDEESIRHFVALAEACRVPHLQERMLRGDQINVTEKRAVLHSALRRPRGCAPILVDGQNVMDDIFSTQDKMRRFVDDVRSGSRKGATGKEIQTIVNIGIGGSDLGPRLVVEALKGRGGKLRSRFAANIDAWEMMDALEDLNPETTLFLVVSKSFTTEETLENARSARAWVADALGEKAVADHFVAVSTNIAAVEQFGIDRDNIFPMWDWVGGRYSLWSAVGLSIALSTGWEAFEELLAGGAAMDRHVQESPLEKNIPFLLSMTGLMYRNCWNTSSHAILPYSYRLRNQPRFLQQLDMESNGKSVTREGQPVSVKTGAVIFGECGTVFQHSFGQLLQQGTDPTPVDFIGIAKDPLSPANHHQALLDNMRAQSRALCEGRDVEGDPARTNPGNRPSSVILLDELTPRTMGLLVALYEYRTFYQGAVWNINSFDQFGVELGKALAREEAQKPNRIAQPPKDLGRFFRKG